MKWIDRILAALRTAARDLISEEDIAEEEDRVSALLDAAQTRLNVLRDELAGPPAQPGQPRQPRQPCLNEPAALAEIATTVREPSREGGDDDSRFFRLGPCVPCRPEHLLPGRVELGRRRVNVAATDMQLRRGKEAPECRDALGRDRTHAAQDRIYLVPSTELEQCVRTEVEERGARAGAPPPD